MWRSVGPLDQHLPQNRSRLRGRGSASSCLDERDDEVGFLDHAVEGRVVRPKTRCSKNSMPSIAVSLSRSQRLFEVWVLGSTKSDVDVLAQA